MTKKIINEGGLRDITKLSKRYPKAKIYFHQDLDGVTSALAMKHYLENNGIKVTDAEVIQYGDKEFAIKKPDATGDVMPVLVDFAHGKPMFVIHTDHHDTQAGAEETKTKSFRSSRSNVETISQIISPSEIFSSQDIDLISMVDSANFAAKEVSVDEVINYLFSLDKDKTLQQNKTALGLVTNKLLLAFKNKPRFLETIVLESAPSIISVLNVIKKLMVKGGYAPTSELEKNKQLYIQQMKSHPSVNVDDNIIVQYGGGKMTQPGSYDRYTPFKNEPNADFLVIAWPLGLLQASCNPFKKDRELKGVNLGEIAKEVLSKYENKLKDMKVSLSTIKWISESSKDFGEQSVGFTFKDFVAIYGKTFKQLEDGKEVLIEIGKIMEKPFSSLTEEDMNLLDEQFVSGWDIIVANSGGHKCITNISGLNYLGRGKRPPVGKYKYDSEKEDAPYIKFLKMLQKDFVNVLKEKMSESK